MDQVFGVSTVLRRHWRGNKSGGRWSNGAVNIDDRVRLSDLFSVAGQWSVPCPSSSPSASTWSSSLPSTYSRSGGSEEQGGASMLRT